MEGVPTTDTVSVNVHLGSLQLIEKARVNVGPKSRESVIRAKEGSPSR